MAGLAQYMATTVQAGSDALGIVGMEVRKGDLVPEVIEGRLPQGPDGWPSGAGPPATSTWTWAPCSRSAVPRATGARVSGIAILPGVEEAGLLGQIGVVTARACRGSPPTRR